MRVLHLSSVFAPYAVGGAERVVATLAEASSARGTTVGVTHLAPSPPASVPGDINGIETWPLNHRNPLWIGTSQKHSAPVRQINKICTIFNVLTTRDFGQVLEEFRPDLVHSHSMVELSPMMWKEVKQRHIPLVHTLHDYDLLCLRGALFKNGQKCEPRHLACRVSSAFKRRFHTAIDHVVGISQAVLNRHLEAGLFAHLPPERRSVVWNPVPARDGITDTPHRTNPDGVTFGFMGRLVDEKGIATLLDACRHLPANGWRLMVAGSSPRESQEFQVRAAGMPVEFVGYVDSSAFLAGIDLLIVPSVWDEPFGLVVVEAYQSGVPVLAARSGGLAEIVERVGREWLFEPGHAADLASAMVRFLNRKPGEALELGGIGGVLAECHPSFVVSRYSDIYHSLV